MGGFFVYETNVTNIPNIDILFEFSWFDLDERSGICRFLKGGNKPMLLACELPSLGYDSDNIVKLIELKEEFIVNTFKYNIRIQPMKKEDKFTIESYYEETYIRKVLPEVLDFSKKDSYQIDIITEKYPDHLTGLLFNEAKQDLICENKENFKRCIVPKEHFEGLKSDYYYIMRDYFNKKEIAYEAIPLKVILPEESNKNKLLIMIIAIAGAALIAIIIIIVIVVCVCRKKNTDLKEKVLKTSFQEEEE